MTDSFLDRVQSVEPHHHDGRYLGSCGQLHVKKVNKAISIDRAGDSIFAARWSHQRCMCRARPSIPGGEREVEQRTEEQNGFLLREVWSEVRVERRSRVIHRDGKPGFTYKRAALGQAALPVAHAEALEIELRDSSCQQRIKVCATERLQ